MTTPNDVPAVADGDRPDTPTADQDTGCHSAGHQHGYIQDKKQYERRLSRIEGQVRGIQRMVDEEHYCIDILTQVSAIQSALRNVARGLLDDHLRSCVAVAAKSGGTEAEEKLDEVSEAIGRLMRS
ncbi:MULTISPECIES: metal-sensitive transcriptional regulator [Brevibacterium]|uniref:DNA-binding transcriptional regulator, FrmR family n=2 Tax=Brevibacterium antiquum TaxID=234835 RepID=A0A2H1KZV7_9MICO|nr:MULTISPECIES: metal-sensitive transcriptional regulator [Brevibacterium]SMX95131.1 DNA-binding transcriptional regulator, FrmR family [Brevibacterium antiquum]SMY05280.1 DNA-binding transcriptional regulator, FrmR family [Brevibacterium antiquum CNRZ 918]HCG55897.1 metal-sensitive transcriptional regulator [Brevibacterium sp.]